MSAIPETLLERVRALLAKAEATEFPAEAEALTAKAAELMARYGIEQAMLPPDPVSGDVPADKVIICEAPWAGEKMLLLYGLACAMRCDGIQLPSRAGELPLHLFGYASDLERIELLYTSLLVQMAFALAVAQVPAGARSKKAWRRSFLAGYRSAVVYRVERAERQAAAEATAETAQAPEAGRAEVVLASREVAVRTRMESEYPPGTTQKTRTSYSGRGFSAGATAGARADLGGARVGGGRRPLGGGR